MGEFDQVWGPVTDFDGRVVACGARSGSDRFVVVNGEPQTRFEWIGELSVSDDGGLIAYPASSAPHPRGRYVLVVNGEAGPPYHELDRPVFGAGGRAWAYRALAEAGWVVVAGTRQSRAFEKVTRPAVSVDGSRVAFWARDRGKWLLIIDDQIVDESDADMMYHPPTFGTGSSVAYWTQRGRIWTVVFGGRSGIECQEYEEMVGQPVISPAGDACAYVGMRDGRPVVAVGDRVVDAYDAVGAPTFSADGSRVAFKAREGEKEFLVIDGERGEGFDVVWPPEGELATYLEDVPAQSGDGRTIAYRAALSDGTQCVVMNGRPGPAVEKVTGYPTFLSGGSVVYGGLRDRKQQVVRDGIATEGFDEVWSPDRGPGHMALNWRAVACDNGRKAAFGCNQGDELWWRVVGDF